MSESDLRAGDADRARVAALLGEHMSAGRLTVDEYDERVTQAYAARTLGDLQALLADLPSPAPVAVPSGSAPAVGTESALAWRASWARWARTAIVLTGIWLLTSLGSGAVHPFWPGWVLGPWLVFGLAHRVRGAAGAPVGRDRHRDHRRGCC